MVDAKGPSLKDGAPLNFVETAVAANDQIALLRYHLGMALLKSKMPERGRDELNQSINMAEEDFPGIEEARAILKQSDS